jgi:hypothetical protein
MPSCHAGDFPPSCVGLIEEANDLASNVLSSSLFVIHNAGRCGQDDVTELTRWQQLDNPLLEVSELNIVAGGDDTGLVETAVELDDDLAAAVIVDFFKFADVTCKDVQVSPIDSPR